METISSENNANKMISFGVLLHYPDGEEGDESVSSVAIDSSASLSALAAKILQQLYQRGKVDGNQILKAKNVKVLIQVRPTWKPLPLSTFVYKGQKESDLSLDKVFGKFLFVDDNQMIVHLHLCNDNVWNDQSVRDGVKKLLENYSQTQLERLNCPLSQGMLSQISRDQYYCKVSGEKVRLFGLWHETMNMSKQENEIDEADGPAKRTNFSPRGKKIVFSSSDELPMLKAWFENHTHPSSQEMTKFAEELNGTEFRQASGREKVDFRHVNNWFKNERARMRKAKDMASVSQVRFRTEYPEIETGENVEQDEES